METNKHKAEEAIERIDRRLTSGNNTPVTQTRLTDSEWALIKPLIKIPKDEYVGPMGLEQSLGAMLGAFGDELRMRQLLHAQDNQDSDIGKILDRAIEKEHGGSLSMLLSGLGDLVEGMLALRGKNTQASFLIMNHDFIERHVRSLIKMREGRTCCADKTSTIMDALSKHLISGHEIAFNYDQEYDFHLPKKVLTTQREIVSFYHAIRDLHYGHPETYLAYLAEA